MYVKIPEKIPIIPRCFPFILAQDTFGYLNGLGRYDFFCKTLVRYVRKICTLSSPDLKNLYEITSRMENPKKFSKVPQFSRFILVQDPVGYLSCFGRYDFFF